MHDAECDRCHAALFGATSSKAIFIKSHVDGTSLISREDLVLEDIFFARRKVSFIKLIRNIRVREDEHIQCEVE